MKRVITGTCLAAAFAVGLAAQTPQTPPPSTPQNPPSSPSPSASMQDRDAGKNVTVTGCLKAGDSADSYTLSDLKWGSKDKSTSAVGTSGTAPAGLSSASTLKVTASGGAKLSEHVGHQVEISGTVGDKDKGASPSASPTGDPASRSASSSSPTFEAKSVKMIAASCSM